jgi:hypothetical protein
VGASTVSREADDARTYSVEILEQPLLLEPREIADLPHER